MTEETKLGVITCNNHVPHIYIYNIYIYKLILYKHVKRYESMNGNDIS